MTRTRALLAGLLATTALLLAACSGSAPAPEQAAPPDTTETAPVDTGASVLYLMGDNATEQWPVEVTDPGVRGGYQFLTDGPEAATAANAQAYQAALTQLELYLTNAWAVPYATGETRRDAIGTWVVDLAPGADEKWGPGPTWVNTGINDVSDTAGDIRVVQRDSAADAWVDGVTYTYQTARIYPRYGNTPEETSPKVLIERAPSGALRAVYVLWAVETGYRLPGDVPAPERVNISYGVAKLVPTEGSDANLRLLTPDAAELPEFFFRGKTATIENPGTYSQDRPAFITAWRVLAQPAPA